MINLQLVHKATGVPVKRGDQLVDFRGDEALFDHGVEPHHPGSTGRAYVREVEPDGTVREPFGYYPSVYGLVWKEVE